MASQSPPGFGSLLPDSPHACLESRVKRFGRALPSALDYVQTSCQHSNPDKTNIQRLEL